MEGGEKKNALVKLRLCPDCSYKLNYHKIQEMKRDKKRKMKKREEEEEEEQGSSNDDDEEGLDSAKRQRVG